MADDDAHVWRERLEWIIFEERGLNEWGDEGINGL